MKSLKQNTKSFKCPTRGVTVYEDMTYQSAFKEEQTHTEKRRMDFSQEETVRGLKRAKAPTAAVAAEAEHSNKLDEKQPKATCQLFAVYKDIGRGDRNT